MANSANPEINKKIATSALGTLVIATVFFYLGDRYAETLVTYPGQIFDHLPVSAQRTFFAVGWLRPLLSRLSGAGFTYSHVYPPALCLSPRATDLIELLFIPVSREASAMDSYIFPVSKHRTAVFLGTVYSSALSILDSKSSG